MKLREIVARHGQEVVRDVRRVEGLLRDYCGEHRREVAVLVMALEERVPADLLGAPATTPRGVLLARLAKRLCDDLALSEAAARWAVNSWALALGQISDDELKKAEQSAAQAVAVTPAAQPAPTQASAALVVAADGRGDYKSINEALKRCAPGARVVVRPGVYEESVTLDREVEIVGEGPRDRVVVRASGASCFVMKTDRARIVGLTLRGEARAGASFFAVEVPGGNLRLEGCDISSDTLSCVGVHGEKAAATLQGCLVRDGRDSGVYVFDRAEGAVEDCEVVNCANVCVAVTGGASASVRRSRIHGGQDAGLVVWRDASVLVEACDIYGNRRAGLGVSEGGRATVRWCRIHEGNNSGVFVHDRGTAALEDCDLFGHREAEVAVESGGRLTALRCQIHDGLDSGVYVRDGGKALLRECVVAGNGGVGVRVAEGGLARVLESDLMGNRLGAWDADEGASIEGGGNRVD